MTLQYTHRPLNGSWSGPRTSRPGNSPFGSNWGGTLELLERELRHLKAKDVVLVLNVGARDVRNDGGLRADARIRDHAVIVEFRSGPDRLSFPCDRFNFWQDNVRAIALALEALRKVDRYGVRSGRQYEGFKALPGAGGSTVTLSLGEAATAIAEAAADGHIPADIAASPTAARAAIRLATAKTHPDRQGGDARAFHRVQEAKKVLTAHHGGAL